MPRIDAVTDSADSLRELVGEDATATFEDDPTFVESNPTEGASSENVEVQRDTDDLADSDEEIEEVDDDEDDIDEGVDEDALDEDDMDTDKVTAGWPAAVL
jgi:hypothetical protein